MITATLVKSLRDNTGAGMMDCKKALEESNGNFEAAVDWLRVKGLAAAATKAGRATADGLVAVSVNENIGTIIEINTETDFVARNEQFQAYVNTVIKLANGLSLEQLKTKQYDSSSKTVEEELSRLISVIGENMTIRRLDHIKVNNGVIASYIHSSVAPGMGKIGVLIGLESTAEKSELNAFGKKLAMHIAAANPQAVNIENLDPKVVEREKSILSEQARSSGKPEEVIQKMVEGRLRKFYEEAVLMEQVFVIDAETKIKALIEKTSKELGSEIKISGFIKFVLGEGLK